MLFLLVLTELTLKVLGFMWSEFDSSSTDWTLSEEKRKDTRQNAYCTQLCGFGFDAEADGYQEYRDHFFKTKSTGEFRELTDVIDGEMNSGYLSDRLHEVDSFDEYGRSQRTIASLVEVYCEVMNVTFDNCYQLQEKAILLDNADICMNYCNREISYTDVVPKFEDLAPGRQEYEKCLEDFKGPGEVIDFNDKENATMEKLLESFQKYGFLFVENYFSAELMHEVNRVVNDWHEAGVWKNYTFAEFYSHFEGQLSAYEFRKEFVLPFEEPFKTVLSTVHNTVIMEVLRAYGGYRPVILDFPASIMSYPGATQQHTHGDHGYEASMVKVGIAIHDIYEINGPTSFCPCTHKGGLMNPGYNKPCGIRYHPSYIKAGTLILYDMCVKHRGSVNDGETRRYLLDLSYSAGYYYNQYENSYPETAQNYTRMYRAKFKDL